MKKIPRFKYEVFHGEYRTVQDWKYKGYEGIYFKISKGFVTNGASIPRALWWVLSPFDPRYIEECTVHDYLCDLGQFGRADFWFNQLLKDNPQVNKWTRKMLMAGVKSWHRVAYQKAGYYAKAKPRYLIKKMEG